MNIGVYDENNDYDTVNSWFVAQTDKTFPKRHLSNLGFVVKGVAAGFLVITNTSVCFMEPFIANPRASEQDRDKALTMIIKRLENAAKAAGMTLVYGITTVPNMIKRGLESGFKIQPGNQTLLVKEIK